MFCYGKTRTQKETPPDGAGSPEVGDWHEVTPQRFSFRAGIVRKARVPDRSHIRLDRGNECIRCRYRPPMTGQAWLAPFPDFDATHLREAGFMIICHYVSARVLVSRLAATGPASSRVLVLGHVSARSRIRPSQYVRSSPHRRDSMRNLHRDRRSIGAVHRAAQSFAL